jgi:septum site-determining protein MinC
VTQNTSRHIRFRGHSFPALALEPELPLSGWIDRLDAYLAQSPAFFARKSIVIDVSKLGLERKGVVGLVNNLTDRGIRIMGLTGVDPAWTCAELPPILSGGRAAVVVEESNEKGTESERDAKRLTATEQAAFQEIASALTSGGDAAPEILSEAAMRAAPPPVAPLVVNALVRSGQTIFYPEGDVTIVGSVSSGADVIAGGSIHIYGALRGRAMAGAYGEMRARIFCRKLEAELLAVGGIYLTADEIEADVRSQPVQVWLENEGVRIARLD